MGPKDSLYPADWFRTADKDLQRAGFLLEGKDPEGAGINVQQALEKYFKGYLIARGWKLRKIHDLDILLNAMVAYDPLFEEFRPSCLKITQYYMEERYPVTVRSELTLDEVRCSLEIAIRIVDKIRSLGLG